MKKQKYAKILLPFLLSAAVLAGCSQSEADNYIGIDAAKEAALRDAGIQAGNADFSTAGLDKKDGTFFYQVVFTSGSTEYTYAVDALTGVVIEANASAENQVVSGADEVISSEDGTVSPTGVSAEESSSEVLSPDAPANDVPSTPESGISAANSSSPATAQDAPLSAALTHAGLSKDDIFFPEVKTDWEDGREIYEISFISADGTEYEYEIAVSDLSILSFSQDSESSLGQLPAGTSAGIISEAQAKQAVLDRVPGADETNLSLRLREDDGRQEYKGKLLYETMLYEFKIDAYSGMFIEWEAEAIR